MDYDYWIARFTRYGISENLIESAAGLATFVGETVTSLKELVADILPVALPVLGIGVAVFFGIKFIKKVVK